MNRVLSAILLALSLMSCNLIDPSQNEGVLWEYTLTGAPVCGVVRWGNYVFVADDFGKIYSIGMDTGLTRWSIRLSNETILFLHFTDKYLYVVSKNQKNNNDPKLRVYNPSDGIMQQSETTNLPIVPFSDYLTFTNTSGDTEMMIHNSNTIATINLSTHKMTTKDLSADLDRITKMIYADKYFYMINADSKVVQYDSFYSRIAASTPTINTKFYGSAAIYKNYLILGTDKGVSLLDTSSSLFQSGLKNEEGSIKYSPISVDLYKTCFYVGYNSYPLSGIVKFNPENSSLKQEWYFKTFYSVTYCPIVVSSFLGVVAFIDDSGELNVVDRDKGASVYNKQFGVMDVRGMNIAMDYNAKTIFVPLSAPTKVVAFSLSYAMTAQE